MKCPNCGAEENYTSKFCSVCGFKLTEGSIDTPNPEPVQSSQGTASPPNTIDSQEPKIENNISNSAANTLPVNNGEAAEPPVKKKKTFGLKHILIIVIVLVIAGGGVFGVSYYSRYQAAQKKLSSIDTLINNQNYKQAYYDVKDFQSEYDFGKFPGQATDRLNKLNEIANQKYKDGLNLISTDNSTFDKTASYFVEYKEIFPFSSHNKQVDKLLDLISKYNESQKNLEEAKKVKEFLNNVGDILTIMEKYVSQVEYVHNLADKAINGNDQEAIKELLVYWDQNKDYFYAMADDVMAFGNEDKDEIIFTQEEYAMFKTFILNGLVPAEALYALATQGSYDHQDTVKQSWATYADLKPKIDQLISTKRKNVQDALSNIQAIEKDVQQQYDQIKNFATSPQGQSA